MVNKTVINTCNDGTAYSIVSLYAKGGRSNFCAWNGADRFVMTAVLEEYDVRPTYSRIYKFCGYGTGDDRDGSHLVKYMEGDGDISPTLTTLVGMNMVVLEEYEED